MRPAVVFLGPSLPAGEAREVLDCEILPPAAHGDVLRAALRRPRAIGIVDGVFERVPAIWHKEILFALSEGIHVYGAASMGALRAAELDVFGMRGVGAVYADYAAGTLEDDDEVAVAHADADHGFLATSDAMVDVRATLAAAVAAGVVDDAVAEALVGRIKAAFYPERHLVAALDRADEAHERLRAWLPDGRVHRKRDDALALLRAIRDDLDAGLPPFRPAWTLQRSRYWEDARRAVELEAGGAPGSLRPALLADGELEAVLDEARLDPAAYRALLDEALVVALARRVAAASGVDGSAWAAQAALDEERRRLGLISPHDVERWLAERGGTTDELPELARRLAVLRWARDANRDAVAGEIAETLRADPRYPALAERARRKREALAALPSAEAARPDDAALVAWWFRERLGEEPPAALDLWATDHGWPRPVDLVRALRAEWRFVEAAGERSEGPG